MMDNRVDVLTSILKAGNFSVKDIDEVASIISKTDDPSIKRRCIYLLGKIGGARYEDLIASFLDDETNLTVAEAALSALVIDFKQSEKYLEKIKGFLGGDELDEGLRGARLTALQIAGDAYKQSKDEDLLKFIVQYLDDDSAVFRESAQKSLTHAMIDNIDDLNPAERRKVEMTADIDELRNQAEIVIGNSRLSI